METSKSNSTISFFKFYLVGIVVIFPFFLFAQGPPSGPGGGGPPCGFPYAPCIPIDQGTWIIIIIGILFASFKLLSTSKKTSKRVTK